MPIIETMKPSPAGESLSSQFEGDETARMENLRSLTPEDFDDLLIHVNARLREKDPSTHTFDGHGVKVGTSDLWAIESEEIKPTHRPPDQEDKQELLHYALQTAQSLHDVRDAALLLGAAINLVHPFADGNGRTSRYVYTVLAAGREFLREHHKKILGEHSRNAIDVGSALPNSFLEKEAKRRLGADADDRAMRAEAVRVLCDAFTDPSIRLSNEDIPFSSFRSSHNATISLPDYLRNSTNNTVTSNLVPDIQYTWVEPQDGRPYHEHRMQGYKQDNRFTD